MYVSFASQTFETYEDEGPIEVEVKLDKIAQTDTIVTVYNGRDNGAEGKLLYVCIYVYYVSTYMYIKYVDATSISNVIFVITFVRLSINPAS